MIRLRMAHRTLKLFRLVSVAFALSGCATPLLDHNANTATLNADFNQLFTDLKNPDPKIRIKILEKLASVSNPTLTMTAVVNDVLYNDADPLVRLAAIDALTSLNTIPAYSYIRSASIVHQDDRIRKRAELYIRFVDASTNPTFSIQSGPLQNQ